MIKVGVLVFVLMFGVLSSGIASAGVVEWVGDLFDGENGLWGEITGKVASSTGVNVRTSGTCNDSDGGLDYYVKGEIVDAAGEVYFDECSNGGLIEKYCDGDVGSEYFYECPDECFNGACASKLVVSDFCGNGYCDYDNIVFELLEGEIVAVEREGEAYDVGIECVGNKEIQFFISDGINYSGGVEGWDTDFFKDGESIDIGSSGLVFKVNSVMYFEDEGICYATLIVIENEESCSEDCGDIGDCYDTDNGLSYYKNGVAEVSTGEYSSTYREDTCYQWVPSSDTSGSIYTKVYECDSDDDSCFLDEAFCSGSEVENTAKNCFLGCRDGACIDVVAGFCGDGACNYNEFILAEGETKTLVGNDELYDIDLFSVEGPNTLSVTLLIDDEKFIDIREGESVGLAYGISLHVDEILRSSKEDGISKVVFMAMEDALSCSEDCGVVADEDDCFDSDDGRDYYEKGVVDDGEYLHEDTCFYVGGEIYGNNVAENWCDEEGVANQEIYECPNGCVDGACISKDELCSPRYYCEVEPAICPSDGVQVKKCYDVDCDESSYEEMMVCNPGQCSGCEFDKECVPYGFRVQLREDETGGNAVVNMYCDIDGKLNEQKTVDYRGDWATCQNNYECESNLCSSGECIEIQKMMDEASSFKGFFVGIMCRFAHFLNEDNYDTCMSRYG